MGWKLLEQKTFNDITLLCWYNSDDKVIQMSLFNLTEQPNELSQRSPYTTWGYLTHFVQSMYNEKEAAEVVSLYLQDMENNNLWWEKC